MQTFPAEIGSDLSNAEFVFKDLVNKLDWST